MRSHGTTRFAFRQLIKAVDAQNRLRAANMDGMPMRTDCKYYESRTYASGETVRKCDLDLAPEAPWRCPAQCAAYERRLTDANWTHGSLLSPPTPPEPPGLDEGAAQLLDEAEEIVNAAGPEILTELANAEGRPSWWKRWRRRRGR